MKLLIDADTLIKCTPAQIEKVKQLLGEWHAVQVSRPTFLDALPEGYLTVVLFYSENGSYMIGGMSPEGHVST